MEFVPMLTQAEFKWFKERTHVLLCEDMQGLVAYRGDTILAACVADTFTVHSCNVHMAIDNPMVLRHGFLEEIAHHLFNVRGCHRIFGLVPDNNEKALKLDKHIGFKEVTRVPDALADGIGYIVMRMDKEECPWLKKEAKAA
jgi:L-amino acid N-acyltransferase YncA